MTDRSHGRAERQVEFDAMAPELGLSPEPTSVHRMESRTVGAFLLSPMGKGPEVLTAGPKTAPAPASGDDDAIRKTIVAWEKLHPEEVPARYREFTTDPFVGVGDFMAFVDEERIKNFLSLDRYQKEMEPTLHRPRQLEVSNVQITHLSSSKAAVTYRVEEERKGGEQAAWNTAAIMVKDDSGWKVAAIAK